MTVGFDALRTMPPTRLDAVMRRGARPDPAQLIGEEFRGANTARWTRWLRFQQFVKGFEHDECAGVRGYNRRVAQDGTWSAPSEPFAFFDVRPVDPAARHNRYLNAVLLDYDAGGKTRIDPVRFIRDYLVCFEPGSHDLLLGRAFLDWGPLRPSPTYFVLERLP